MAKSCILDVRESIARAITSEERHQPASGSKRSIPTWVNCTAERSGELFRRYGNDALRDHRKNGLWNRQQKLLTERIQSETTCDYFTVIVTLMSIA